MTKPTTSGSNSMSESRPNVSCNRIAAAVAAAKSGLLAKIGVALAKMGKAIIIGIAVIGAGVWKLLFGNKTNATLR